MLYERAGVTPPEQAEQGSEVLSAIAADPLLSARQRSALREVYESFVATSPQGRARQRAGAGSATRTGAGTRRQARGGSGVSTGARAGGGGAARSRKAGSQEAR
jgi:hypothetical protein